MMEEHDDFNRLVQDFLKDYPKFILTSTCVVFSFFNNSIHVLLRKHDEGPEKGTWLLPFGFVMDNEDLDNAARRILAAKTGLENVFMEQVRCFGNANRYPYSRVIAVMYYALIDIHEYDEKLNKRNNTQWFPLAKTPKMLYDQNEMIEAAARRMRYRTMEKPVGLEMLSPLFTMTQLRTLVEAIDGKPRDKRNFRKLVEEIHYIEKTDKIDKTTSKRGAALYRFNQELYEKYIMQLNAKIDKETN